MKKLTAILLILIFTLSACCGCSDKGSITESASTESVDGDITVREHERDISSVPTAPADTAYETDKIFGTWKTDVITSAPGGETDENTAELRVYENSSALWLLRTEDGEEAQIMYYDILTGNIGDCEAGWHIMLSAGQDGETLIFAELKNKNELYLEVNGETEFTASCVHADSFSYSEAQREKLHEILLGDEYVAGIAYLGKAQAFDRMNILGLLLNNSMLKDIPFTAEIPEKQYIDAGGRDIFCIVPFAEDAAVTVNGLEEDGRVTDVFYRSENGAPILIACEADGAYSHVRLNVTDHRENGTIDIMLFEPNGLVDVFNSPFFCDFTVYRDEETQKLLNGMIGSWTCDHTAADGTELLLMLEFREDGSMDYSYGPPASDITERFEGVFYIQRLNAFSQYAPGAVSFDMKLTGGTALTDNEPYDFYGVYDISLLDGKLSVRHTDESCLIYGADSEEFIFSRSFG